MIGQKTQIIIRKQTDILYKSILEPIGKIKKTGLAFNVSYYFKRLCELIFRTIVNFHIHFIYFLACFLIKGWFRILRMSW